MAELDHVRAERDRYRRVLANIAGQNSGIWGVMAHDVLTGKHQEHSASSESDTSPTEGSSSARVP